MILNEHLITGNLQTKHLERVTGNQNSDRQIRSNKQEKTKAIKKQ